MGERTPTARVVRALTSDGHIRLSALDATPLWGGVRRGMPHLGPDACAPLVELLSGAALVQSRTLLTERVQLVLRSSGRAKAIVADAWPDGGLRGILDINDDVGDVGDTGGADGKGAAPWVAPPGNFQVMRSNPKGSPYIGTLELTDGPISAQVEHYLQQSEQVQACVVLWCDAATGHAGGLLVEPLPFCPPDRLRLMLAALEARMSEMGVALEVDEDALRLLAEKGFDPKFGARPLRRVIQTLIEDAAATSLLDGDLTAGDRLLVTLSEGEITLEKQGLEEKIPALA